LVKDVPKPREAAEPIGQNGIEQVVQGDDGNAEASEKAHRKMNQCSQGDHGNTDSPKDNQDHGISVETDLRKHDHAQQGELKEYEPNAPRGQESRQFTFSAMAASHPEKSAETGGEHEHRRAEMRDPASKENGGGGAGKISWRELHSAAGNVVANVVDGHQYHDRTTDRVHRLNPGSERGLSGNCRSGHRGCELSSHRVLPEG
jgi:hypothetical protein